MMDTDFLTRTLSRLKRVHSDMRKAVMDHAHEFGLKYLSGVSRFTAADTIYKIDDACDEILLEHCHHWGKEEPFLLIAEGIENGSKVFPESSSESDAEFRLIVDPIDGTRGLMYDKRSAWILSGVAPNRGPDTSLADIELAIQTEIPITKQYLVDMLYAIRGRGTKGERLNLMDGKTETFYPRPSQSDTLKHGFAMLTKFFPGRKQITAAIEEELLDALGLLNPAEPIYVFDDQYLSTGGQLYELTIGHDRFSGDFRAHLMLASNLKGLPPQMAVHPYDLCTELIAREAGVLITDLMGTPLDAPLDVTTNVSWLAYANPILREQIEPVLQKLLRANQLI
jgi:fructose-1,6-bisphosphatase/inositol monophosphatase family enzyme